MIDRRDVVMEQIRVGLVEVDPLLEDRLVVPVQRQAAGVVGTRTLEAAGLDLEQVVVAVPFGVDPLADGIAVEARLERRRPIAAAGVDSPLSRAAVVNPEIRNLLP